VELLVKKIWIFSLIIFAAGALHYSCGNKIKLPTETPPTGNLGDTLYLLVNPPWDSEHGYDFSNPTAVYFGNDTYLYVADTGHNRILQYDAAGTLRDQFPIEHPISISQDELMRLLVVTGEKKIYKIDVGPTGDRTAHLAFDFDHIIYSDTTILKHHNMIRHDDRFMSISDLPATDKSYFVAVSSDSINDGRILWFWGSLTNTEYADSLFDPLFGDSRGLYGAVGDTFSNPMVITGNGITTTTHPNFICAYQLSGVTHLIVCQDSGSYPVHDMLFERQVWDLHWVFNFTHSPSGTDLLARSKFNDPKGAAIDPQGNIYVVDAGVNRHAGAIKFSRRGEQLETIDDNGYTFRDVNDLGGPVFAWHELNPAKGGSGTATGLGTNSNLWVQLGFAFNYYRTNYDSLNIGSNGWCNFLTAADLPARPTTGSSSSPNAYLSPYGIALKETVGTSSIFYQHDTARNLFIVQYDSIPRMSDGVPSTFELIMNPADSSIIFQYKSSGSWGDSAIICLENAAGSMFTAVPASRLGNAYAVKFNPVGTFVTASGITYDIYGDRRTVYIADTGNNRILRYKLSTDLEQ
jgi:hypothetical protein